MILRRVINHFKNQEWTAIFLDFLIVVVGVFVGLQVSNWNEAREDRARGDEYLERLYADLTSDHLSANGRMAFWREVRDYGDVGLAYGETGLVEQQKAWDVLLAYFQASQVNELYPKITTFDEMRSAGELGLIQNVELRQLLTYYYSTTTQRAVVEYPAYREHVRGEIPLSVQNYIWETCYESTFLDEQVMKSCDSPISPARARAIIDNIAQNDVLMKELRYWMSTMTVATFVARNRLIAIAQLQAMIDEELGRDPSSSVQVPIRAVGN